MKRSKFIYLLFMIILSGCDPFHDTETDLSRYEMLELAIVSLVILVIAIIWYYNKELKDK